MNRRLYILLPVLCMLGAWLVVCAWLCSCSCRHIACGGVDDARRTIAVADSLRVNEGVAYDDSLALAETYDVLGRCRLVYPDDYARACYYYGRLLRNRGNQVEAMQAFICGTHAPYLQRVIALPWFSDYHILGRIYSNMGTMCHLEGSYTLSYKIYEQSASCFLAACDSIDYYYAKYNMAYELAEQSLADSAMNILLDVECHCSDEQVNRFVCLAKAQTLFRVQKYDSALHYARHLHNRNVLLPASTLIVAQCFSFTHQHDSASFYAQEVANSSHLLGELNNAYYILANDTRDLDLPVRQQLHAHRADIQKQIEIRQGLLSHAVEILQQDMDEKYNPAWIIIVSIMLIMTISTFAVISRRRSTHKRELQVQTSEYNNRIQIARETERKVDELLHDLHTQQNRHKESRLHDIEQECTKLRSSKKLARTLHLSDYNAMKRLINIRFNMLIDKLEAIGTLSNREIQFCVLVLLNVPQKEIAEIMVYSDSSIKRTKANIATKMKLTAPALRNSLIDMILH